MKIRGKPESWAAGVYYTYCRMILKEGVSRKSVEEQFAVSQGTFTRINTEINKLLNIGICDKRFTPARIYGKSPLGKLEQALTLIDEKETVTSYFEVKEKNGDEILLVNMKDGGEYLIREKTHLQRLKTGQIIHSSIYHNVDTYIFTGVIEVFNPEDEKHNAFIDSLKDYYSSKDIRKALEIQGELSRACLEYFGSTDPVFESAEEAMKALNTFMRWFSHERIIPGRVKTPAQGYIEDHGSLPDIPEIKTPRELLEIEEVDVGLIFDETEGMYVQPHYGEVKELFLGNYRKIPSYRSLVRALVTEEGFVPPFLIRKMINGNPKRTLELFAATYKEVKSLTDVFKLFEKHRSDWNRKPEPSVTPMT